jgi:hypothetical protein
VTLTEVKPSPPHPRVPLLMKTHDLPCNFVTILLAHYPSDTII